MTLPEIAIPELPELPELNTVQIVDPLVGHHFWWDAAPPAQRRIYQGFVADTLGNGYYLLQFAPTEELPAQVREIAHVSVMAEQNWSFYETADLLAQAIARADVTA